MMVSSVCLLDLLEAEKSEVKECQRLTYELEAMKCDANFSTSQILAKEEELKREVKMLIDTHNQIVEQIDSYR